MRDIETRTLAPLVAATTKRLGADLPAPVAEAMETAQRLRSVDLSEVTEGPDLGAAVAAAVLAGRSLLSDKAVQRAMHAKALSDERLGERLAAHAAWLAAEAVIKHAGAVVDAWRPAVERANEALQDFRSAAPGADLTDDTLASRLPALALTPWGRAREATALLGQVEKGWTALARAAGVSMPHFGGRPLIVADLSLEELDVLGAGAHADAVAKLDVPLDLADLTTYADRTARLAESLQGRADYDAAAPDRAREERRRTFAIRVPAASTR